MRGTRGSSLLVMAAFVIGNRLVRLNRAPVGYTKGLLIGFRFEREGLQAVRNLRITITPALQAAEQVFDRVELAFRPAS